jgi:hypothetical protein
MVTNPESPPARATIVWPWMVAGFLSPFVGRLLEGPLPPSVAKGLSFFVLFGASSYFVLRGADPPRPLARALAGAACGAAIVAALTEAFP